jgi:hypothetical protein
LFEFNVDSHPHIFRFERSFLDLNQILRQRSQALTRNSRPASPHTPIESAPPLEIQMTPPPRHLGNQSFDSPESTISNRSAKAEHYTDTFANNFLGATLLSLEKRLNKDMAWYDNRMRLLPLYCLSPSPLTLRSKQVMKLTLGKAVVGTQSDGGLSFYPKPTSSSSFPVFCIEVFHPSYNRFSYSGKAKEISVSRLVYCKSNACGTNLRRVTRPGFSRGSVPPRPQGKTRSNPSLLPKLRSI